MTSETKPEPIRFSVDLLFSEPLHFDLDEIIAAVNEDFPSCQIKDSGINPTKSMKTDDVVLGIIQPVEPQDGASIHLIGAGFPDESFRNANLTEELWRSGGFGQQEVARHQSYLSFSVDAVDDSLASRFRAARLLNVVTAVFAKLPITLAIYNKWTGHFVRPTQWVEAAETAVKGEWPLTSWISYRGAWNLAPGLNEYAVGYTVGLSQFLPYEIHMESAPIKPTDVLQMLFAACWMPLQGGSVYEDGNTVGVEEGVQYRIRERHTADGKPAGIFVLLHPDSPVDEEATFGPRPGIPTPVEDPYIRRPKKGFMQGLLGRN